MSQFSFCASHSIPHFCDLLPFLRLACSDTHIFRSGCLQRQHSQVWSLSPGLGLLCPYHPHHPQGPLSWGKAQSLLCPWCSPDGHHSLLQDLLSGVFPALILLLCRYWNGGLCGLYSGHSPAEPLYLQPKEQGHEGGPVEIFWLWKMFHPIKISPLKYRPRFQHEFSPPCVHYKCENLIQGRMLCFPSKMPANEDLDFFRTEIGPTDQGQKCCLERGSDQ